MRDHPPAMQVADAIRRPGPPQCEIQHTIVFDHRDLRLARTGGDANRQSHGTAQPRPRSNCAVSNSGNPTTPEWLPDRNRTKLAATPLIA